MQKSVAKELARLAGHITYIPSNPCKRGHYHRNTKTGSCVECNRIAVAIHSKTPKGVAYRKKWRSQERVRFSDRQYQIKYSKRRLYGLSWDEYLALIVSVSNKCEICDRQFCDNSDGHKGKRSDAACIDHDHRTGKTRGVLCNRCNRALGLLGDEVKFLKSAITYLEKSR